MLTSSIDWVHAIFNWAVHALVRVAQLLGISYEEINIWLFRGPGSSRNLGAEDTLTQRRRFHTEDQPPHLVAVL